MVKGKASGENWVKISSVPELTGAGSQSSAEMVQGKGNGKGEKLNCPKCKKKFSDDAVQKILVEGITSYICPKCSGPLISAKKERAEKRKKNKWCFYKSRRLGLMFGPIPVGIIIFGIICYAIYRYFGSNIIGYIKPMWNK